MKEILISIKPEWVEKILDGSKGIEIRKTMPKCELPCKVYIYCTKGQELWGDGTGETWHGIAEDEDMERVFELNPTLARLNSKIVAEFTLKLIDKITDLSNFMNREYIYQNAKITEKELWDYSDGGTKTMYGWHIEDLIVYDRPKALIEFRKPCISPEMPYCPDCRVGCESISESEAEFYRAGESCRTEWCCLNFIKRPPQSWCYVEIRRE